MSGDHRYPWDIAVVGLGIRGVHQITREVEEAIRRCTVAFVTDMAVGVVDHLRTLCPEVIDLSAEFRPGSHRILIYQKMAGEVVTAALEKPPVCFASYGHPKVYCYPTTLIQRAAKVLDLRVTVLPGVSSLDALLVDLNVDPALDGLQVYDATDLLVRERPIQTDTPCVLFQAPIALDALNSGGRPRPDNVGQVQEYLLRFYPPDHRVTLLVSAIHPLFPPIKTGVRVADLAGALRRVPTVATVYLPPVGARPVAAKGLAERMRIPAEESVADPPHRPGRPPIGPRE
ncbi:SAM-dependent methyltransferase [Nonomuraea sp. NPDC046570]|uniref:SAM-dependent methyltransferase n=1 Tax=Nonomuraea sp. NPDC046570 TaxID=3155255 RepID=UPI0033EC5B47